MKCFKCNNDYELTWARYFRNPLGKHVCPACNQKLKFKRNLLYRVWISSWVLSVVGCAIIIESDALSFALLAVLMLVYFPIDKYFESKLETQAG
jgi:hypothetical protein